MRTLIRATTTLAVVALLGAPAAALAGEVEGPAQGREVAFVADGQDGTVTILDARTYVVLRTVDIVPDGATPSIAAGDPPLAALGQALITQLGGTNLVQDQDLSPDGRTLYVSRGHRGDVAAIDLATGALRWKVPIQGLRSDHMTISHDGKRLYVSALTANVVEAIDTEAHRVVGTAPTGQWPHDNHLTSDGKRLYNSSIGTIPLPEAVRQVLPPKPYQLTVIDPATMHVLRAFTFDRGIRPTAFTADGTTMFAQRSLESSIMKVRLSDGTIQQIAQLPVKPGVTSADYDFEAPHHGLALSADERTLCVAGRVSDYAALVATDTLTPRAIVPVGDAPGWAATSPDGKTCVLPNTRENTVSFVSFASATEVARVRVGAGPKQIEVGRIPEAVLCTSATVPGCAAAVRRARRSHRASTLRLGG